MAYKVTDVNAEFSYYRLLDASEQGRWNFADLPWDKADMSKFTPTVIHNAKEAAFAELTTFSATEAFMKLFRDDTDFTQWLAVWFYEETKHPLAWIRYLSLCGVKVDDTFIHKGREITPMTDSRTEMLTFNIISEITACTMYQFIGKYAEEPLCSELARNLARDEMRHSVGFEHYCKKTIEQSEDPAAERLRALRATWFVMQPEREGLTRHPVLLSLQQIHGLDNDLLLEKVEDHVLTRISKMLNVEIPSIESLYDVYAAEKKAYRQNRKAA